MKRKKQQPKRGNRIVLVESYVKSKSSDFESVNGTIYYIDTKRKIIWEQDGINVAPLMRPPSQEPVYQEWARRIKPRSLNQLLAKYDSDFERFSNIFVDYSLNVTEIGTL